MTLTELFNSIEKVVKLVKTDIKALYAKVKTIPTKVSQLENDKGYLTSDSDTTYKLSLSDNKLKLIEGKSGKVISTYDLSVYLDDTTLPKITSGVYSSSAKKVTFTRSDKSTFAVDLSALKNITKTSELTNDGADGTHPYLSTADVPSIDFVKTYKEA